MKKQRNRNKKNANTMNELFADTEASFLFIFQNN